MKKQDSKWYDKGFRLGVLALVETLVFAGVMSLVQGDIVVRYSIASVLCLFTARELW